MKNNTETNYILGERLSDLIAENKIDINILSQEISLSKYELYHWKQERYCPSLKNLIKIADYFKVTLDYLLGIKDESNEKAFNKCPIFCQHLTKIMIDFKMNINKLSKISGVDRNTLYSWLSGKRQPQVDALIKISKALNISVDYLIGREN